MDLIEVHCPYCDRSFEVHSGDVFVMLGRADTCFANCKYCTQTICIDDELGLVQLDENQDTPQNPYGKFPYSFDGWGYAEAVNDMLKDGFRKVKSHRRELR